MTLLSCPWVLDVEVIGAATVVRFTPPAGKDDATGYALGKYLLGLVEQGAMHLVLNLGAVDYVNSLLIGKFFALHKRVKSLGGRLVLCGVRPPVDDLFALVRLPELISVFETEEEALAALEMESSPRLPRLVRRIPAEQPETSALVEAPRDGIPQPGLCASS